MSSKNFGGESDDERFLSAIGSLEMALERGPGATADVLAGFLSGAPIEDEGSYLSVEWLSDYYASSLEAVHRGMLRDALVLLIVTPHHSPDVLDMVVAALTLAEQVSLLDVSPRRVEERLWQGAHERRRLEQHSAASVIVGFLATFGQRRSVTFWTGAFGTFGVSAASACLAGVARHGARIALEWMDDYVPNDLQDSLMAAQLPRLAEQYQDELSALIHPSSGHDRRRLRERLNRWMARYGIRVAPHSVYSIAEPTAFIPHSHYFPQTSDDVVASPPARLLNLEMEFASYDVIDNADVSLEEAVDAWTIVMSGAELPKILEGQPAVRDLR